MKLFLLLFICFFSLIVTACAKESPSAEFVRNTSEQVIAPAYHYLSQQSNHLAEQAKSCKQADPDYRSIFALLDAGWKKNMAAWQAVQWVQFGPSKQDGREWALQFWPDKKNLVGRKIKKRLDGSAWITEADLDNEGIVVQGLSAFEYLLYDEQAKTLFTPSQRCLSMVLIANKIQQVSRDLHADWLVYHDNNFVSSDKPRAQAEIASAGQGVSIIINNVIGMLDKLIGKKIVSPFALAQNENKKIRPNAYFLESWRSQTSRENVKQNILSFHGVLHEGGLDKLLDSKQRERGLLSNKKLSERLNTQLKTLLNLLENDLAGNSFFLSISESTSGNNIQVLYTELVALRSMIKTDISQVLEIQLGFNSSDGDS